MRATTLTGLLWLAGVTAAPAQRLSPPFGREVRVRIEDTLNVKGELLAVSRDSIWVLQRGAVASVPWAEVSEVRVNRGGMGAGSALGWSLAAGVVSGALLSGACSSVADADCSAVLPATMVLWLLVGAASAPSLQNTRYHEVQLEPDSLRAHARFPQGLPPGLERHPE